VPRIRKVLVANRGEIARRVLGTLRTMGVRSVAVFSDADAGAPHVREADEAVRIGAPPSRESYLAIDRILDAARATGADAVHPGYGFLAENAGFAERCAGAGLVFIGPPPAAIRAMGSKIEAKRIMAAAGVPVIPGVSGAGLSDDAIARAARALDFPLLVKASAGGGGKGMRVVRAADDLAAALAAGHREALAAFGDDTLLVERYVERPRHVEIQIFADAHGRVVHLFERECSIQRRYQKVIEEAPSPGVDAALRARMGAAAVTAASAVGYVGAGTVEFVLAPDGQFYFLEVNTRLQVEHPVTELVTGLDLVRLQVEVAERRPLPFTQDDLRLDGHAIEARLYAEDPARDFLPATGTLLLWQPPALPGVRWDAGVEAGSEVGVHYDPMLAKVIAHGATRAEAVDRLTDALERLAVAGVATNRELLLAVLRHPAFASGALDTHFIERHLPPAARTSRRDPGADRLHAIVAALHGHAARRRAGGPLPPSIPSGWRNNRWRPQRVQFRIDDGMLDVSYVAATGGRFAVECDGIMSTATVHQAAPDAIDVEVDGVRRRFRVATAGDAVAVHGPLGTSELVEMPRLPAARRDDVAGGCVAPMTGIVRAVHVGPGDRVQKGQVLLVLEAMKMEHELTAQADGVVREVRVEVGQMVDPDAVLVIVSPVESETESS
jgi:acetyl-CoA carboxylase biotin carboxylase subunit